MQNRNERAAATGRGIPPSFVHVRPSAAAKEVDWTGCTDCTDCVDCEDWAEQRWSWLITFQKQRIDVVSGVHVTGDIFVQLRRLGCIAFGVLILLRLFARLAEVGLGGVFLIFLVPDGMEGWCVRLLYLWLEAARGRLVAAIRLKWHGVRIDQRLLHFAPTDQRIDLLDALFSLLHDLVTDVFFNYVDHVLLLLLLVGGNLALRSNVLQ